MKWCLLRNPVFPSWGTPSSFCSLIVNSSNISCKLFIEFTVADANLSGAPVLSTSGNGTPWTKAWAPLNMFTIFYNNSLSCSPNTIGSVFCLDSTPK